MDRGSSESAPPEGPRTHGPGRMGDAAPQPGFDAELGGLLAACARGDEKAFAALYERTSARLFGLILQVVRDRAQAEEVAQDVYHEIWRHSARYDPARGSTMSWMLTIAHRRAVDRVRASGAATRRDVAYEARIRNRPYDQTAESAARNLEAARVRQALAELTEKQRSAVELAYLGGYTHTEIAGILDLPLGTTKTRIRDGLLSLRAALGLDR